MKKLIVLLFMILLLPFAFAAEFNSDSTNIETQYGDLYITLLKYEPYPVTPGEYFDLWIEVENKGLQDSKNVEISIQPNYPFSIDPSEKAERNVPLILSHSATVLNYKVRVDENSIEGESIVDFEYSIEGKKPQGRQVRVLVQTMKAILSVQDVNTEPEVVAPGETAEIKLKLKNNADSYLKFVTAAIQLAYSTTTGMSELPFTPIGGGNEQTVHQIAPGDEVELIFKIVADPDAEIRPYKLPVNINYYDELGKNYSKLEIVGVIVGSSPDLYVVAEDGQEYKKGTSGEISLKFVNKGTSPVKFLNVQVDKETEIYKIVSSDQTYIGKIDSDDYDTANFKIFMKKNAEQIEIPIKYEYMDGNNKGYSVEETVILQIYSSKELGKTGGSGGIIIFAIIIIVIAYVIYRRWKKKAKKNK